MMQRTATTAEELKSSLTALGIAQGFTRALAMEYGYLFSDSELGVSKHLCTSVIQAGVPEQYAGMLASPYSDQRLFCNKNFIPAYDQTTMLRKLMIKNKINEAIRDGVEQIIFLGGGYDIRAFITAKTKNVAVYELDRGPTRTKKLAGIKSIPEGLRFGDTIGKTQIDGTVSIDDKLFFIECDFIKDNVAEKLKAQGYREDRKTLIIAEGLTAYLTPDDNKKLLSVLDKMMKDSDELLISYIDRGEKAAGLVEALKVANEEHQLSLDPDNIIAFTRASGFAITQRFYPTRLLSRIGDQADDAIYKAKKELIKEYYLMMRKGVPQYQNISDVPFYEFDIPEKDNKLVPAAVARTQP